MNVLVVGGAGFIGANLIKKLKEQDHEITVIDNLITGSIKNVIDEKDIQFINADICKYSIKDKYDQIYHLGSLASPKYYKQYPLQTIKVNTIGSMNLLEYARQTNAQVLFTSTSEIYGSPLVHPQEEKYWGNVNSFGERSCYDEAKRCGEAIFYTYKKKYDVQIRIARIFNTYGPYMLPDDGRVVSNFIVSAYHKRPLVIYGDGQQTRSFCYVDDMVNGLIKLMNSNYTDPINLGNPHEITIYELATKILQYTNSGSKIEYIEESIDDPCRRQPDISLAAKVLDWYPKVVLEDGLKKTIEYLYKGEDSK